MTKARVNTLVVATTFFGFALYANPIKHRLLLMHVLIGTGLIAGSAAVANQFLERQYDRLMVRTRHRPLATGQMQPWDALIWCVVLLVTGIIWLGFGVNSRALSCALLAFGVYVFLYTPLKRRTPACTLVGAVAGALPILTGWAATGAGLGFWAVFTFVILFLWQIPHFLAIASWRREDYERAGYRVLPARDLALGSTARWTMASVLALIASSFLPLLNLQVTVWFIVIIIVLNAVLLMASWLFWNARDERSARRLFRITLIYLPPLLGLCLALHGRS